MNQSVQAATPLESPCSPCGSEISTCKAVGEAAPKSITPDIQNDEICNSKSSSRFSSQELMIENLSNSDKKMPESIKLSNTTQHLQRHVVTLYHDIQSLTNDLVDMRTDVSSLQEGLSTIKLDADRVGETVTILSQEAARASRQIVSAAQVIF